MSERGPAWYEHPHSKVSSKVCNRLGPSKDHGPHIDYSWFYSPQLCLSLSELWGKASTDRCCQSYPWVSTPRLERARHGNPIYFGQVHGSLHSRKSFLALHSPGTPCTSVLRLGLEIDCSCLGNGHPRSVYRLHLRSGRDLFALYVRYARYTDHYFVIALLKAMTHWQSCPDLCSAVFC